MAFSRSGRLLRPVSQLVEYNVDQECPSFTANVHYPCFYLSSHLSSGDQLYIRNPPHPPYGGRVAPLQTDTYWFDPQDWANMPRPFNIAEKKWPPQQWQDLLSWPDVDKRKLQLPRPPCLGEWCWGSPVLNNGDPTLCAGELQDGIPECNHNFETWMRGCHDWEQRIELCEVPGMGVAAFSKVSWSANDILGCYVGKLIPFPTAITDYALRVPLGPNLKTKKPGQKRLSGFIDSELAGNWTRFINHSCAPNAQTEIARVGDTLVLCIMATKDIRNGEEITIDYGDEYFFGGKRKCLCRARDAKGKNVCKFRDSNVLVLKVASEQLKKLEQDGTIFPPTPRPRLTLTWNRKEIDRAVAAAEDEDGDVDMEM